MNRGFVSWSGGKDSALALYRILQDQSVSIEYLLTNINADLDRVAMHEVRSALLEEQARAIGIRLLTAGMPDQPDLAAYRSALASPLATLAAAGCTHAVFGDIFLEDLRRFREQEMAGSGMTAVFPLWGASGAALTREFLALGFKAIVICVDASKLAASFCGREIDEYFLQDLPEHIDPAGENGEFHSFVYDGPIFRQPVCFQRGNTVYKEYRSPGDSGPAGFYLCDLQPCIPKTIQS